MSEQGIVIPLFILILCSFFHFWGDSIQLKNLFFIVFYTILFYGLFSFL